jgi:hypothetical protein
VDPFGDVAGGDGLGRVDHPVDRPQPAPDDQPRRTGDGGERDQPCGQQCAARVGESGVGHAFQLVVDGIDEA